MDNAQKAEQIDARFDALEDMEISDDQSARDAFTHAMLTVSRINQLSAHANAQAIMGAGTSVRPDASAPGIEVRDAGPR
jgi:hypothetical protein